MTVTSEKFARMFLALDIPLSEEEWWGLKRIFEKLQAGITECLPADGDDKGGKCRICGFYETQEGQYCGNCGVIRGIEKMVLKRKKS